MKSINNFNISGKKVIIRADLNVPFSNGQITDDTRILHLKKTIKQLIKKNNKIFLISHFGRPTKKFQKELSLKFLVPVLKKKLMVQKVHFLKSFDNKKIKNTLSKLQKNQICLFENIRFNKEEENNNLNFAKKIANNFDIYVNEAFSASHRKHASVSAITRFLPSYAGIELSNEIHNLNNLFSRKIKPSVFIIGGSKISTKLALLNNLVKISDTLIIVGAMANTFLFYKGFDIGNSLVEKKFIKEVKKIFYKAKKYKTKILIPTDAVCAFNLDDKKNIDLTNVNQIESNKMILDIGNKTINLIKKSIKNAKLIVWNGPPGAFEYKAFSTGTKKLIQIIKGFKNSKKIIIAGGGDTVAAIKMSKATKSFTYISTAGGAFLEWLEGKKLPGIKALEENKRF